MATERLDIRVNQKGAKKVSRDISKIGGAAKGANKAVGLLAGGIAAFAAVAVARKVIGLANTFVTLENQVKTSIDSTENLSEVMEDLFDVADRTKQPIDAITTLFQRASISSDRLGASTQDLIDFSETVSNALRVQGASAETASGALLQLSQAIGNGTVRAEEFNSIIDGAPTILQAAAEGIERFGGDVALLRNEVIKGKVSSKEFFDGILSQSAQLERKAAQTSTTVDQAFTRINNALIEAAGGADLGQLTDALDDFADLIADPAFQKGFAAFVSGVISLAGVAVTAVSEFGKLGDELGFIAAAATGATTDLQDLEHLLQGVETAIKAETIGGFQGFLIKPIQFTGDTKEELIIEAARIQAEIDEINQGLFGFTVKPEVAGAGRDKADPVTAIDEKLLASQQKFLAGLATSNAELEIQARLGDAAADALARYRTEQEIIALELTPAQAEAARGLTEEIIKQNAAIQAQADLANQADFIISLEQQEERLRITGEAGTDAEAALLLYDTRLAAIATGAGPEFVALALDIAGGINAQNEALAEQARIQADSDLITGLREESELIGLSNRERAIEVQLRQLSADATQEQITAVRDLAGQLFDENEALRRTAITFDEFLKQNARAVHDTLAGALSGALGDGLEDLPATFAKVLQQLASQYLASAIFKQLSSIGQSDGSGAFAQAFGDFFAGGFATGGQFTVPGTGGTDSQLVAFRATPGEKVDVRRPTDPQGGAPAVAPQVNVTPTIVNTIDSADIVGAFNEGEGDAVLLNRISVRRGAFKRALGL